MPMHGQLNGTNLKVEVGDNFMSDYTTYTNYAKKAIRELEQLADFKKSLKGKKLADKIREAGLKLITKSGVDSILHGLGESNGFQNLTPAQKQVAEKLVSLKDTALTHKSSSIQGVLDENAEMAQSDITKIIDYSEKLQSMFDVNDNLEDWVKAKLNHACDYVATVRDYLKFYNEEKQKGTQNIEEKWTNKYKKSIDCSNAKGFSQKAHCAARRKRQAGGQTSSKSVKEYYKEALQELLKEQNSSMAMGALKQLNSDAKELETMLQPNTQLEDWVKAKLNLAGEYLDDVYHHLDHFGPQGRKHDEIIKELNFEGGIGFHEFVVFYQKANQDELQQMEDCLKNENKECVKDLILTVTKMEMDKIQEGYYEDKEKQRQQRMLRFNTTVSPEKKYWFTPDGKVVEAGYSHEEWIRNHDSSLVGATLIDTYDNAVKKGYIRAVLDLNHNFLTLSNMQNYDFSMNGDSNIPAVNSSVKDAIKNFIADKAILLTATGKGKIIKDFSSIEENQITENWKSKLATAALAASTMFGTPDVQAAPTLTRPETTAVSQVRQPYTIEEIVAATLVDEAGGEKNPIDGMHAVLNVIMNRAKGNIRQAAVECLKPKQFSGWNKINKKDPESIKQFIDSKRNHSKFKDALDLVNKAKSGSLKDITKGANHFLNVQLTKQQRKGGNLPSWYDSNKVVADYGKHRFLKLQEMYELS